MNVGLEYKTEEKMCVNLNYLDYPLLLKYHFKNGIELSGGILLSFILSDKIVKETTEIYETYDTLGNIITVNNHIIEKTNYRKIVDNNDPNALLTGFQIGISYAIKKFNFSLILNKNSSFGDIQNIGNNQNITLQFQLGYIFKKNKS